VTPFHNFGGQEFGNHEYFETEKKPTINHKH